MHLRVSLGQRFNSLTVVEREEDVGRRAYFRCKCDCGNFINVRSDRLSSNNTRSCGCLKIKNFRKPVRDHTGKVFGRLTVKEKDTRPSVASRWVCLCECGKTTSVLAAHLVAEKIRSCGCLKTDTHTTHGMTGTKIYGVWRQMHQRCGNPNDSAYHNYGGRWIVVCERWKDFDLFFSDMGYPPKRATLDRKDNNGPYSSENCRWATWSEQHSNRRNNRNLTAFGETKTITQWAAQYQMSVNTLKNRIDQSGLSVEVALTLPKDNRGRKLK